MPEEPSRAADIEALTTGVRWRWGLVWIGAVVMTVGRSLGTSEFSHWIIFLFITVGSTANVALAQVVHRAWRRWWLLYVCCLIDVSLVAIVVFYLGPGGTIAGFLYVILPCAFRPSRTLGLFALFSAAAAFLIAVSLHSFVTDSFDGRFVGLHLSALLDLMLLAAIALPLLFAHTELTRRITYAHSLISQAVKGPFMWQTHATRSDSLGLLQQSLNTLLEQVAATTEDVGHEAAEAMALAELSARSASITLDSSRQLETIAAELAWKLGELRATAEAGHAVGQEAAREARSLQSRAEGDTRSAHSLEETVQLSRDRAARTNEAVLATAADLRRAASLINELGVWSRQIASSALSIAKVARQTHVLALNAAIAAARAEEHGEEFAIVADQVRTLAGDAGHSAREVGDLVIEMQASISAAADAMLAGEEKVSDIALNAGEARSTLNDLRVAASNAADLVVAAGEISRSQAKRAESLVGKLSQFSSTSARLLVEVDQATGAIAAQVAAMHDLDQVNRRLSGLAERLRKAAAHSSLHGPSRRSDLEVRS